MNPKKYIKQIILTIFLVILFVAGIYSKQYTGPGKSIISDKIAGLLYVVFWSLLMSMLFFRRSGVKVIVVVLCITCMLEFLQLYSSPLLSAIRSTFIGRSLIGNSFAWSDFPYYFMGALLAIGIIRILEKSFSPGKLNE